MSRLHFANRLKNSRPYSVKDSLIRLLGVIILLLAPMAMSGQNITPVEQDDEKPQQPTLHYYDKHGNKLDEPVLFLATLDTVQKPKFKPLNPLYGGVTVGVNFFDAILMAAGQKYGSYNIEADVSLHNWFFPVVEAGIGYANKRPDDGNFRYRGKPSPFLKIGLNYNFLYNSSPDYMAFLGVRAGWSHYSFAIENINVESGYWNQQTYFSMDGLKATSYYGEVLAGIRVKLWKFIRMGWSLRYHFKFHTTAPQDATPYFIPGYGANSPITATLSLSFLIK